LKAIHLATRNIIKNSMRRSHVFAEGVDGLPSDVCEALVKFEQRNRGHQHLLNHEVLASTSTQKMPLTGHPHNAARIRDVLASSFVELFNRLVRHELPRTLSASTSAHIDSLLDAKDELGYIEALVKFDLREFCELESFTGPTCFDIVALRLEVYSSPVVLHLRIRTRYGKVATRSVKMERGDIKTLRGAGLLLNQAHVRLEALLKDVSTWPELARNEELLATTQATAPQEPQSTPHERAIEAVLPDVQPIQLEQSALSTAAPADSLEDPEVAAFLARLQHDMRGFLNAYSPLTRAFMEKHWGAFRGIVNEPPASA